MIGTQSRFVIGCLAAALAASAPATAQQGEARSDTRPAQRSAPEADDAAPPRRTDTHIERRDRAQADEAWEGSFPLPGLYTRAKIGGFVELNAIHDTDAIGTPTQFVTAAIRTGNASTAQGADGRTSFSVQASRLYVETRTPIEGRRLTTFVSGDLFGESGSTTPQLRLRQAYVELSDVLFGGDLLAGQAWSSFAHLEAFPNTLDFEGPNSFFGLRQPLLRWSKVMGSGRRLMVAAETPRKHSIEGAKSQTRWPDGVVALSWDRRLGSYKGALVVRDLRASRNNGPTESTLGWGATLAGKVRMPGALENDFATLSLTYGRGIGSAFNDSPADAVFDSAKGSLEALDSFGWFASYQHRWDPRFNSTLVYGELRQNNRDVQAADAFRKTQYASANLVWTPFDQWLFGVELLYGTREDKNGADGSDLRTLFSAKFSF